MKNKKQEKITQVDLMKSIRRPMPRPTLIQKIKRKENKNWKWQDEFDENDDDMKLPWED